MAAEIEVKLSRMSDSSVDCSASRDVATLTYLLTHTHTDGPH